MNVELQVFFVNEQVDTSRCLLLQFVIDQSMNCTHLRPLQGQESPHLILMRIGVEGAAVVVVVAGAVAEVVEEVVVVAEPLASHFHMQHAYLS